MQRRRFILLTAFGSAATAFTGLQCSSRRSAVLSILEKPDQLSFICDEQTIREIGLSYQLQKPEEANARILEALLLTDRAGRPVSSSVGEKFIQTLINNKTGQDFQRANTVVVRGWILALTEARQCALFAAHNQ